MLEKLPGGVNFRMLDRRPHMDAGLELFDQAFGYSPMFFSRHDLQRAYPAFGDRQLCVSTHMARMLPAVVGRIR